MSAFLKILRGSFFWTRVFPSGFVNAVASLGFGGKVKAPGTWGSAAGLLFYTVFFQNSTVLFCAVLGAVSIYLACAFCDESEKRLGAHDPGRIILDEFVAMPLVFLGVQAWVGRGILPVWGILLLGFALFRLFDVFKPFGIRGIQKLPGGVGVVMDDVAAALWACVTLHMALFAVSYFSNAPAA